MAEIPFHRPGRLDASWESSSWEGNRRWRLERTLAATPLQRLLWLEEALELAWRAGALSARRPAVGG